eukprot:XP_003729691.2 PREDICTED: uncharacterized protein DDB_G0271670 [Strongylocentrotus purpuratus]
MAGRDQSQDRSRDAARRKRVPAPTIKKDSCGPIFGTPVKSDTKDDLSRTVQNTLGLYDNFKVLKPHELGRLHGVQYQPQTPVPGDTKNISHFPVINGQTKPSGQHSLTPSGSSKTSSQVKSSPAEGSSSHRHGSSKPAPAGASSSSSKGVKREPGTASQLSSSSSTTSSSSSKTAHPSTHEKSKDSSQRRSKDGTSGVKPTTKAPVSGSSAESSNLQPKASTNQSSKPHGTPSLSSSSSTSKPGSSRPSTTNSASRGSSNSSSNSNASDSKTVLHPNGLLTETCLSITNYPPKQSGAKSEQKDSSKQASGGHSKKDSGPLRDLPFISPMPDIIADFQSRSAPNPAREGKKDRDGDAKQRPRLDIPKKGTHQGHSKHKEVEKIFEKMTALKTPVSAIQTPVKAEVPKFPFDDLSHTSGAQPTVPRKKLVETINKDAEKKTSKDDKEGKGSR